MGEWGAGTTSDLPWVMRVAHTQGHGLGTALVVGDTLLLTCAHVVKQLAATDLRVLRARAREGISVEEIREHPDADVALLRVKEPLDVRAAHFGVGMTPECAPEVMRLGCMVHGYPSGTDEPRKGMPLDPSAVDIDFGPRGVESIKLRVTSCEGKSGGAVMCRLQGVDVCLGMVHDGGDRYAHTHAYGADRLVRFLESRGVRVWCEGRGILTYMTKVLEHDRGVPAEGDTTRVAARGRAPNGGSPGVTGSEFYDTAIRTIWGDGTAGRCRRLGTCFAVGPRHVMTARHVVQVGQRGGWLQAIHVGEGHVDPSSADQDAIKKLRDAGSLTARVAWPQDPSHASPEIALLEIGEGDRPFEHFFAVDFDRRWPADAQAKTEGFPRGERRRRSSRCILGEGAGDASGFDNASKSWEGWSGSPLCSPRTHVVGVVSKDSRQRDAELEIAAICSLSDQDRAELRDLLGVDDQPFISAIDEQLDRLSDTKVLIHTDGARVRASDLLKLRLYHALAQIEHHARSCDLGKDKKCLKGVALLLFAARCPYMVEVRATDLPNVFQTNVRAALNFEGIASNKQRRSPYVEAEGHDMKFRRQIKCGSHKDLTKSVNDESLKSHLRGVILKMEAVSALDLDEELNFRREQGVYYSVILREGADAVERALKEQLSALVFIETTRDAPREFGGGWYKYIRNAIVEWSRPDDEEPDDE